MLRLRGIIWACAGKSQKTYTCHDSLIKSIQFINHVTIVISLIRTAFLKSWPIVSFLFYKNWHVCSFKLTKIALQPLIAMEFPYSNCLAKPSDNKNLKWKLMNFLILLHFCIPIPLQSRSSFYNVYCCGHYLTCFPPQNICMWL